MSHQLYWASDLPNFLSWKWLLRRLPILETIKTAVFCYQERVLSHSRSKTTGREKITLIRGVEWIGETLVWNHNHLFSYIIMTSWVSSQLYGTEYNTPTNAAWTLSRDQFNGHWLDEQIHQVSRDWFIRSIVCPDGVIDNVVGSVGIIVQV